MSKAIEENAASSAIGASNPASGCSEKIEAAFAEWRKAMSICDACEAESGQALGRYTEIEPASPADGDILQSVPLSSLRRRLERTGIFGWPPVIEAALIEMPWAANELQSVLDATKSYEAAVEAANEMSGLNAAEKATDAALCAKEDAFDRIINTPPMTMADVRLQAKLLKDWLHDCSTERPQRLWLEVITGEAWPHNDDAASDVEAA